MPEQGITFAGAYLGLPGAYYQDNVSAAGIAPPPVTPPLVYLGYGWGPKPKTPTTVLVNDLPALLRGGPASDYLQFLSNPSPSLNGAQQIVFIDVSENTQSQSALAASGSDGTAVLLTSTLYGPPSNQMTRTVANGSVAGRKLTITDAYSQSTLIGDNLSVPFQLAYSGLATGATQVSYTVTTGATSGAFAISSPIAGESVTIPLGSGAYATTSAIVQYLNGTSVYYATLLSSTQGQLPSLYLTAMSGYLTPPSGGALQYVNVNAYLQDLPYWVNQFASTLCSAAVSGTAADVVGWLPVTGTATFFSGATGVPPVNNDYATALNTALGVSGWTVFCDSNATAVQALMAQHCETASSPPYGRWRRGFTGSSIGDSIAVTETNSLDLDSIQMAYLYPGVYRTNPSTGANQLYSGLHAAAAAAAMATGNPIATPLTNKPLNGNGVELVNAGAALTQSQIIALQNNGVMVVAPSSANVPTIVSDVTTWEADDNVENTSSQQVACRYWLAYSLVVALQPYVGTIAAPTTEAQITNAVIRTLNALIYTGGSSNGVLASWQQNSLVLTYTGSNETAAITVNVTLVGQNRFITVYASVQPLNFTITAAA